MCKWMRPFWGTDCRSAPKSLSSAQTAPLCSAGSERARKCSQGYHFLRCCHSTHGLLFRGSAGITRGGQQQFATQTLRVHLVGIDLLKFTSLWPLFALFRNLILTPAQPAVSNHGLETTVYRPLAKSSGIAGNDYQKLFSSCSCLNVHPHYFCL